jgi:hypothetical protein
MTGAIAIEPVRDDDAIAAASELARDFFAYMRAAFPEMAAAIDTYLVIQDFEGQLATFRDHFSPPHGECMLARLDGAPVGVSCSSPTTRPGSASSTGCTSSAPPADAASAAASASG